MSGASSVLMIQCADEHSASTLRATLEQFGDQTPRIVKRENLDGNPVTWIVVANTAVLMLPKVLEAVGTLVEKLRVRSLKVGDVEIRNPTAADVAALRDRSPGTAPTAG